jgi:hypothetical protein
MPYFDEQIVAEAGAGDDLDLRRSSGCSTFQHLIAAASTGTSLSSGAAYGGLAYNKIAQTYNHIRFCTGITAPSTLSSVVLGVTDSSGNELATTADIHTTVTTANTVYDNIALSAGITLTLNEVVYLGIAWAGTTLNVLALSTRTASLMSLSQLTHNLTRSASGYGTGALPTLTSSGLSSVIPWIELVP